MHSRRLKRLLLWVLIFTLAVSGLLWLKQWNAPVGPAGNQSVPVTYSPSASKDLRNDTNSIPSDTLQTEDSQSLAPTGNGKQFDSFRLRPFEVSKETLLHAWTAVDGKTPQSIRDLAHNETEVARLTEENARIQRRQLVYRKDTAFAQVQRALASGEQVRKLTLPGLDGQELEMEVVNADLAPSGMSGTFAGRLPGRQRSMVTLAFKEGREAFSIMSPEDETFLQGHPREPGEIIITSYDPDAYQPLPGGEPIRVSEIPKTQE